MSESMAIDPVWVELEMHSARVGHNPLMCGVHVYCL